MKHLRWIFLSLVLLLRPNVGGAAVTYVGSGTVGVSGFPGSASITYTATGGAGSMLAFHSGKYFYASSLTNTTWTVGGVTSSFTFLTSTSGHSVTGSFGYLVLPSSGLGTLTFTPPEGTNLTGLLVEYTGVNTASPIGAISVNAPPDGSENLDPGNLTITTTTNGSLISAAVHGVQSTNPITATYAPGGGSSSLRAIVTALLTNTYPTSGVGDFAANTAGLFNVGFRFGGLGGNADVFVAVEIKAAATPTPTPGPTSSRRTIYVKNRSIPYLGDKRR